MRQRGQKWRTWEMAGLFAALLLGNTLHFVYDWTGQARWAAYLAAANESTWEHMKLLAVPWVLWTIAECIGLRSLRPAGPRAAGLLAGLTAIPPAVLRLRGRHRISRGGGGCADLSGGGAAGLLGQHGTPEAGDADRTGVAGGGSAGAGSGLHRLRGVDRVAAGAAGIHRPHQRDAGHPIINVRKSRRSAALFLDRGGRMVYNETTKQP